MGSYGFVLGTVWARRVILLLTAIAFCSALTVAHTGGFVINVLGQRISSHDPVRALVASVMLAGFYVLMWRQYWRTDVRILTRINPATLIAALCAAAALIVGIHWGTFMGTGPDASGYVSEADLWAHGALTTPAPEWGRGARWTNAAWSSAPVGYLPGPAPSTLVPTYSPGLPLMMALFEVVGGRAAVFYVVPLLGALAVWATYLLGRPFAGPWAGALAALLMVCSPIFLWFLVQPMSDVPAAACWAACFRLRGGVGPPSCRGRPPRLRPGASEPGAARGDPRAVAPDIPRREDPPSARVRPGGRAWRDGDRGPQSVLVRLTSSIRVRHVGLSVFHRSNMAKPRSWFMACHGLLVGAPSAIAPSDTGWHIRWPMRCLSANHGCCFASALACGG